MKNKIKIPLFKLSISDKTKREVINTLDSTWLTTGSQTTKFENKVAKYLGIKQAVAVNSCTAGLQILLSVIGGGTAGKVITSPFTFIGTIEAIILSGSKPVLADINLETLNLDSACVEKKITSKTVAIVPVDIAGLPADYEQFKKISNSCNIPLLSDSAHAIGAKYKKKSIPAHTDASVFSFYSTKNLTCGEGGMIVSKYKELTDIIRTLSLHGIDKSTLKRSKSKSWEYDINHAGFKANMSDLHASVGLGQFSQFEKDQTIRERLAKRYIKNLSSHFEYLSPQKVAPHVGHGWHLFIVRLNLNRLKISRDRFMAEMAKNGVECGLHYQPVFNFNYYKNAFDWSFKDFPNAALAGESVVSLPFYPTLNTSEVDIVTETVQKIIRKFAR